MFFKNTNLYCVTYECPKLLSVDSPSLSGKEESAIREVAIALSAYADVLRDIINFTRVG